MATVFACANLFAQGTGSANEGPVFDQSGRQTAYLYSDGKSDTYLYDSTERMIAFFGRDGRRFKYVYAADGSITTVMPDGSQQNSANPK